MKTNFFLLVATLGLMAFSTGATAATLTTLTVTNLQANLSNWFFLGPATPRYLFTDKNAPAAPQRRLGRAPLTGLGKTAASAESRYACNTPPRLALVTSFW